MAVGAGAVMIDHGAASSVSQRVDGDQGGAGGVKAQLSDTSELAPGHSAQAAVHKQRQEETAPVRLAAHRCTQGLLHWPLL